jgi:hypothetical protein
LTEYEPLVEEDPGVSYCFRRGEQVRADHPAVIAKPALLRPGRLATPAERRVTILRICWLHGLYQPGAPSTPRGKCPDCYRADNQRRARQQQAAGRTTAHWQRLKRLAKQAAGSRCQTCGRLEEPTPAGWLDVHLRDEYRHLSHAQVTSTEQVAVTCKPCHGSHHAPEAARTPGGRVVAQTPKGSSPRAASPRKKLEINGSLSPS